MIRRVIQMGVLLALAVLVREPVLQADQCTAICVLEAQQCIDSGFKWSGPCSQIHYNSHNSCNLDSYCNHQY